MTRAPTTRTARTIGRGRGAMAFMSEPLDRDAALRAIRRRIATRSERFLSVMATQVYANPRSPYRRMLEGAGCELADVEASVGANGVEGTLERLRDSGVHLALDEFKGKRPIARGSLTLEPDDRAFENPWLGPSLIRGMTSGTGTAPRPVRFGWRGLAEEAANDLLFFDAHGLTSAPMALWYLGPPGLAGVRSALFQLKRGHPPERWFSPARASLRSDPLSALTPLYLSYLARRAGARSPRPERVELGAVARIVSWLASAGRRAGGAVLRTYASAGVRVAEEALASGVDVAQSTIMTSGEPLTASRRRSIEAAGLRAVPRYAAAEAGLIGGACPDGCAVDDTHVYLDRLAVVPGVTERSAASAKARRLLFTSLSSHAGDVLLNVDLGDCAELERRPCGCALGRLGMDLHMTHIRSYAKFTSEGMGMLADALRAVVEARVLDAGGSTNDFQIVDRIDGGRSRLVLVLAPELAVDDRRLVDEVLDELAAQSSDGSVTAAVWRQAKTLTVARAHPERSRGFKTPWVMSDRS